MKNFLFLFLSLCSTVLVAQHTITKSYQPALGTILNPERGFYKHTEVHSASYQVLDTAILTSYRSRSGISLILRVFYLEDFVNQPIDEAYLFNMHRDFNALRAAGLKAIVRFAYTKRSSAPYGDAKPEMMITHVRQLKHVLSTHSDVIAGMQAGFIGAWGEWYYTDHYAGFSPSDVKDSHWQDRGELVQELLDALPKERMLQIRTPGYKMKLLNNQEPLTDSLAFNYSTQARLAHHNDCFVASSTDFGTYRDIVAEKNYLSEETKYLLMGGETCALAPPYSDCPNSMEELRRFHWSYLNIDYNTTVLDAWKGQGCFDTVSTHLGYRISLREASISSQSHSNGTFDLQLTFINEGFARPYNRKRLVIHLLDSISGENYQYVHDTDLRTWPLNQEILIEIQAGFPATLKDAHYKVFLSIQDNAPSLAGMAPYNIQLANENLWKAETGTHDLGLTLTIADTNVFQPYTGNDFFALTSKLSPVILGPGDIFGGEGYLNNLVFWGRDTTMITRHILRSDDGVTFVEIAQIDAALDYFFDITASAHEEYIYQYFLSNGIVQTTLSDTIKLSVTGNGDTALQPEIDGVSTDWKVLPPLATSLDDSLQAFTLRAQMGLEHLFMFLDGPVEDYEIYLNTDNQIGTGYAGEAIYEGADFLMKGDSLWAYNGQAWNIIYEKISRVGLVNQQEIAFPHSLLDNLDSSHVITMVALINEGAVTLLGQNHKPFSMVRSLPPSIPMSLEVNNSTAYPDSRLEISWDGCDHCTGYIAEKSVDGVDFVEIKELGGSKNIFYDDFLTPGTYYYRIQSRNALGVSAFSDIQSGMIPEKVEPSTPTDSTFRITPNPTEGDIFFSDEVTSLTIYTLAGAIVSKALPMNNRLDLGHLATGVYMLRAEYGGEVIMLKLIKL